MKKLLLFACAVIASFAASAATGNYFISGVFNGWSHAQLQFEKTGTTYTITLDGTGLQPFSGEFLICGGTKGSPDWNDKIGGVTKMKADTEYTYTPGGGNFSVDGVIAYPLTVTFDTATRKIKISGATAENEYDTIYVIGDFGDGWSETTTANPLTLKEGTDNVWEGNVKMNGAKNYFKFKAGSYLYGTETNADVTVEVGTEYTTYQNNGSAFVLGMGEYTFHYILDKNAETGKFTVTRVGDEPVLDLAFALYGNIFETGEWEAHNLTLTDGKWIAEDVEVTTGSFGIREYDVASGQQTTWLYGETASVTLDTAMPCVTENGTNWSINAGKYTFTFDPEAKTLTITGEEYGEPVIDYTTWYLNVQGDFNSWQPTGVAFDADGEATSKDLAIGTGEFEIKIWNGKSDAYYGNGGEVSIDTDYVLSENGGHMTLANPDPDKKYNVTYNAKTNTMVISIDDAVENIFDDEVEAVYYNLQGVRVDNPANGIFVRVAGSKTEKVMK